MADKVRIIMPDEVEIGKDFTVRLERVETFPLPIDGSLLRVEGNPKVFWMQNRERRWIETGEIFRKMEIDLGFTQAGIQLIKGWQMETIPLGKTITQWPESGLDPETEVDKFILGYLPQQQYNMRLPEAKGLEFGVIHSHKWELDFIEQQLDLCESLGLKYVMQVRDGETMPNEIDIKTPVMAFKDHPAYWGVNTIDDFDWREYITRERQRIIYDWVKTYDTAHPVSITGADWKWEEFYERDGFDVLFYQVYAYRTSLDDPDAWLNYMVTRLDNYDLSGKRVIPIIQSFGPRGNFWLTAHIEHTYDLVNRKLDIKSVGCWDWEGIAKHPEFHNDIIEINSDR